MENSIIKIVILHFHLIILHAESPSSIIKEEGARDATLAGALARGGGVYNHKL